MSTTIHSSKYIKIGYVKGQHMDTAFGGGFRPAVKQMNKQAKALNANAVMHRHYDKQLDRYGNRIWYVYGLAVKFIK